MMTITAIRMARRMKSGARSVDIPLFSV